MKTSLIKKYTKKYIISEIVIACLYICFIALSLLGPYLMQYFIDDVIPRKEIRDIILFAFYFLVVYLFMSGIAIAIKYFIVILENNIVTGLRDEMFHKLIHLPMSFYQEHQLGPILERLVRDTSVVHSIWGYLYPSVFSSVLSFFAIFIIILTKSMLIGLLALLTIGVYVFVFRYYNEKLRTLYMSTREDTDKMNSIIHDAWNGAKEIKIFQTEKLIAEKFGNINAVLKKHNSNMAIKNEFSSQLMSLATTLGTLVTLCVGGYLVIKGELTVGMLVALQTYVAKLYTPAQNMADMAVDYKKYQVNIERINQVLCLDGEDSLGDLTADELQGTIKFERVDFSYGDNHVLNDISFELQNKGKIAFVGKSGSGKTTMLNLLMGFIRPSTGKVFWGEYALDEYQLELIRKNISLVSQDTYLFHMSIYENIRMGNPQASEEEINRIIKLLEIDKIADRFAGKLDTVISEMGKNISGGQLQRISIARALLKKAPVMILDEATSNIDSLSEQIIQKALDEIKDSTLIILISHRLSSLKETDKIYVLEKGRVIQEGNFQELISIDGGFKTLFQEQIIG